MIKEARQSPFYLRQEVAYPTFFFSPGPSLIKLGSVLLKGPEICFSSRGKEWLAFKEPEVINGPIRINAYFQDERGATVIRLENNVMTSKPPEGFDFEQTANSIKFSSKERTFLALDRSSNDEMNITKADFWFLKHRITVKNTGLYVNDKPKLTTDVGQKMGIAAPVIEINF